jgi:hypothetical protein
MKYTIKAHPTLYAGVMFRSRLEARWAAFFDLLGWEWKYEPVDLDGWTPDFYLKFPCSHSECNGCHDLYVEVKPYSRDEQFEGHFAYKVEYGCVMGEVDEDGVCRGVSIGADGAGRFGLDSGVARFMIGHGDGGGDYDLRFFVPNDGNCGSLANSLSMELWKEAGNKVQWQARRSR